MLGSGSPPKLSVGAYDNLTNDLVGVMTFGNPSDERGATNLMEMKRFITDGRNNPGMGSKMFKWSITQYNFDQVIAFVDRRWFSGNFKFVSGFEIDGYTPPSLFWTNFKRRYHRRFVNKEKLKNDSKFINHGLSKREMLEKAGYFRIWDCGKIRLKWKNNY